MSTLPSTTVHETQEGCAMTYPTKKSLQHTWHIKIETHAAGDLLIVCMHAQYFENDVECKHCKITWVTSSFNLCRAIASVGHINQEPFSCNSFENLTCYM